MWHVDDLSFEHVPPKSTILTKVEPAQSLRGLAFGVLKAGIVLPGWLLRC